MIEINAWLFLYGVAWSMVGMGTAVVKVVRLIERKWPSKPPKPAILKATGADLIKALAKK